MNDAQVYALATRQLQSDLADAEGRVARIARISKLANKYGFKLDDLERSGEAMAAAMAVPEAELERTVKDLPGKYGMPTEVRAAFLKKSGII